MTKEEALKYEVANSLLARYISNDWLQEKLASYFAWKVKRKYKNYCLFELANAVHNFNP